MWKIMSILLANLIFVAAHEAKDFDDSISYKIDFEMPDFDKHPELKNYVMTFYTHEKEKYDCVIPFLEDSKEEPKKNDPELSPYTLLQPLFTTPSCSYRIEAYWSYEICHGHHVRQYHEEREGLKRKSVKFQEYYLGKWSEEKSEKVIKNWEEDRKAGIKYRTTKIDNTKYPYFELEMSDGTMCDIIDAPRTTIVRYVCYPHGKNEIYSFKETSSCNYEAIILTSVLCMIPAFHPEESKEASIKCFNSPTEPHKPLSMLRQELNDLQMNEDDIPVNNEMAMALARTSASGDRYMFLKKFEGNVDKLVLEIMAGSGVEVDGTQPQLENTEPTVEPTISDFSPIKEFISGKNCLTGGTGWWKYEFCYGKHVRQFHKDKKTDTELFLGFFSEEAHRQWLTLNPERNTKRRGYATSLWHHYQKGSTCDRTGQPREVDVKLTCIPVSNSASAVSMYLLEPKTCQYILVVESPIICDLMVLADEFGLVTEENMQKFLKKDTINNTKGGTTETTATTTTTTAEEPAKQTDQVNKKTETEALAGA